MELGEILRRFERGELSAPVALMQMLVAAGDLAAVKAAAPPALRALLEENRAGCARICAMLASGVDAPDGDESADGSVAFARRLFDWSVAQSEEASVALYSLGNPELLAAATREVVDLFEAWGLLGPAVRCLQIGCGIGRFEAALAPRVAEARGLDVSPNMIAAARRRCAGIPGAVFELTPGRDLQPFPDGRFELVYAVDSFPYLGPALARSHFAEVARVLVPSGRFALFNFSYGGLERDVPEVRALAAQNGLVIEREAERPLRLWDGAGWLLRKA